MWKWFIYSSDANSVVNISKLEIVSYLFGTTPNQLVTLGLVALASAVAAVRLLEVTNRPQRKKRRVCYNY